jgi:hypothetical protein
MDALQTAVRVGIRVAWRHVSAAGRAVGLSTRVLSLLAEAMFFYADELSSIAVQGYTAAEGQAAGTQERRRRDLLHRLLGGRGLPTPGMRDLAAAADWPLPELVVVIAVEQLSAAPDVATGLLGPDVLADLESETPCLMVAGPVDELPGLVDALAGRRAAIGPAVPPGEAHRSHRVARQTLGLVQRGVITGPQVVRCADHLSTLLLFSENMLFTDLTRRSLEPFRTLPTAQRTRLAETVLAWLECRGVINDMAARLNVHPHTVSYRMNQIQELMGERLADRDERFALTIALRFERLRQVAAG